MSKRPRRYPTTLSLNAAYLRDLHDGNEALKALADALGMLAAQIDSRPQEHTHWDLSKDAGRPDEAGGKRRYSRAAFKTATDS